MTTPRRKAIPTNVALDWENDRRRTEDLLRATEQRAANYRAHLAALEWQIANLR